MLANMKGSDSILADSRAGNRLIVVHAASEDGWLAL
jgi:hypothetical protein